MRKIKLNLQCRVPSWNYCNLDGFTADNRMSKELCRFCVKTKAGHRCTLHDTLLEYDGLRVFKNRPCVDATAGFAITADEPTPTIPTVDPKFIMRETINMYKRTVSDLLKQGYPQQMAETIATKHILEDNTR